jgi:hypothetical protein
LPTTSLEGITGTWSPAIDNTTTTTYTFTPDAGKCASSTTLTIDVDAIITPTFTQLGPYRVGDIPDVLPVTSNNGVNGIWTPVSINTATEDTRTYTFLSSAGGCVANTTMEVTVTMFNCQFDAPEVFGVEECKGNDLSDILANKPMSTTESVDTWKIYDEDNNPILISGAITDDSYSFAHGVDNMTVGTTKFYVSYIATESSSGNQCESAKTEVSVVVNQLPDITITAPTTPICFDAGVQVFDKTVDYASNGLGTGSWAVDGATRGINSSGEFDPTFNGETTDTHEISYSYVDGKGCTDIARQDVMVYFTPAPQVDSFVICKNENIELMYGDGTPQMIWISHDAYPSVSEGNVYEFENEKDLDVGIYQFTVYDYDSIIGCKSPEVPVSLRLVPPSVPEILGAKKVCENQIEERYATKYNGGSIYDWKVSADKVSYVKDDASKNVLYVDWGVPGYDTLMVMEQTIDGCVGYDTIVVETAPYPIPSFDWSLPGASNIVLYTNQTIQDSIWNYNSSGLQNNKEIPYDLYWDFGANRRNPDSTETLVRYKDVNKPLEVERYLYGYSNPVLRAVNSYGCESSYSEKIFIDLCANLYVPNAFSPMNPAQGVRYFQPKGFNIYTMEIWVYDLWGNLVWYSNEVDDEGDFMGRWDGRYKGKVLKSDTYIWKIEAVFKDGQDWKGIPNGRGGFDKIGPVILLR